MMTATFSVLRCCYDSEAKTTSSCELASKLQLQACLEELGIAFEIEPVQGTIPVAHFQTHIV